MHTEVYGSIKVEGFHGRDTVALDSTSILKVEEFPFVLATSQTGIRSFFDGILGMGRRFEKEGYTSGPQIIDYLKDQGVIEK